jgi:hypothetical protein
MAIQYLHIFKGILGSLNERILEFLVFEMGTSFHSKNKK